MPPRDTHDDHLFLGRRRRPGGTYEAITVSGVQQLIGILADEDHANVARPDRPVSPHALRHAFITEYLRRGISPMQLIDIVGHEYLTMLKRYTHLTPTDAYAAMRLIGGR